MAESTILALVAQAATAMVDGDDTVVASLGPVELDAELSSCSPSPACSPCCGSCCSSGSRTCPARMAADTQAELRQDLFDAYSRTSWDVQAEERDGHLQELLTNQIASGHPGLAAHDHTGLGGSHVPHLACSLPSCSVRSSRCSSCSSPGRWPPPSGHSPSGGACTATLLSRAQVSYAGSLGTAVRLAEETYTFGVADAEREHLDEEAAMARHHYLWSQFTSRLTLGLYQGLVILLLMGGLAALLATGPAASPPSAASSSSSCGHRRTASRRRSRGTASSRPPRTWTASRRRGRATSRHPSTSGDHAFRLRAVLRFKAVSFSYDRDRPVPARHRPRGGAR